MIEIIVPEVGEVGGEVTFVRWVAEDGALVDIGEPLFEVDTAKAVLVVEAFAAGRISHLPVEPGAVVEPHQVVALLDDQVGSVERPAATPVAISPRARRLAERLGVSLDGLPGTGPAGRIQEADVERAAAPAVAARPSMPELTITPPGRSISVMSSGDVEALDITDPLEGLLRPDDRLVWLATPHTTGALIICEGDAEMLLDVETMARDLIAPLEPFRHHRNDNPNGRAHLMSSLMGTQLIVPCAGGRLSLGPWQRILFVELDGPKERQVHMTSLATLDVGVPA